MNKIALEIDLSGLTLDDLDLACDGITSALALLEAQGYMDDGGEIHAGLSLAKAIAEAVYKACQKTVAEQGGAQ